MAEKKQTTGKIISDVVLKLSKSHLEWGKWATNPSTEVGKTVGEAGVIAFVAQGRDSSATGNEGTLDYVSEDGVTFSLYFCNPYTEANAATIVANGGAFGTYDYSVEFPVAGSDITCTYSIRKKKKTATIASELLLRIPKCEDYPAERLLGWIGDKVDVSLSDILAASIPAEAKIWCILNLRLLDAGQMRVLAREFAGHVLTYIEDQQARVLCSSLLERLSGGIEGTEELRNRVGDCLKKMLAEQNLFPSSAIAAVEAAYYAACPDVSTALGNSGSCARAAVGGENWNSEADWQIEIAAGIVANK